MVGKFKLVLDLLESNKDWKEKFVWVALGRSNWSEVIKEALAPRELSPAEKRLLDQIKEFTGSRKMEHLFDKSVLWVARVSVLPPSASDQPRANMLILGSIESVEGASALVFVPHEGPLAGPVKCSRQDLAPSERRGKKKLRKVGSQGPSGAVEMARTETIHLDEGSPGEETRVAPQVAAVGAGTSTGDRAPEASAELTRHLGKEPIVEGETVGGETAGEKEPQQGDLSWPYPHRIGEIDSASWDLLRTLLMGTRKTGPRYEKELSDKNRFEPLRHLDKRSSVLESCTAQAKVVE